MENALLQPESSAAMDRKAFLTLFGTGAAALFGAICLAGCGNTENVSPADTNVDLSVDLTSAAAADLNNASKGYIYIDNGKIILAKTTAGTYVAVQSNCTHEGVTVNYSQSSGRFICPRHNSQFDNSGTVLSGVAPSSLKRYTVTQTGNNLHIAG